MRSRVFLLAMAALLLTAAAAIALWRVPELRELVFPEVRQAAQQEVSPEAPSTRVPTTGGAAPDGEEAGAGAPGAAAPEDAVEPTQPTDNAPSQSGQEACPTRTLDPIADFARFIAERYAEWRRRGGVFLPARDLAALYGLDVYALPQEERPPSPGITPVALQLGYFVVGPRFVASLVEQGEALRPVLERDLADSGKGLNAEVQDAQDGNAWIRGLLTQTAAKARSLAACRDGEPQSQQPGSGAAHEAGQTDCRFAHAFMQGLAGPEVDAGRLESQTAAVLQDLAGKLEARADSLGQDDAQGGGGNQPPEQAQSEGRAP